ncbi:DUF3793 family protein [Anaerovorax odorimutans]|uniref:DUF3793 family protein n=1 Tax=Anaerovorax odorimutans TaxID=109327 RepID=UPI00042A5AF7|nr:DUF3793 family protein [Anaerovorax odorimutans]
MSKELIIRHCSPTLAGLKTGSIFNCFYESEDELNMQIDIWNNDLSLKGVKITLLRKSGEKALLYVYRPKKLENDLAQADAKKFLMCHGYSSCNVQDCIEILSNKLIDCEEFPHEIGLFLGYPLSDIKAFITNKGKNFKCVGCWKVYFNECEAMKIFAKYKKCTNVYCKMFTQGASILKLTVAA